MVHFFYFLSLLLFFSLFFLQKYFPLPFCNFSLHTTLPLSILVHRCIREYFLIRENICFFFFFLGHCHERVSPCYGPSLVPFVKLKNLKVGFVSFSGRMDFGFCPFNNFTPACCILFVEYTSPWCYFFKILKSSSPGTA